MPIDPTLQAILDAVKLERISDIGVARMRDLYREASAQVPITVQLPVVENRTISDGIGVRIYSPRQRPSELPVVVFYHGGGWTIGDLDTHDALARAVAEGADAVVVSVDYRLAPEHPFPAAVDDAFAALRWVGEHAAEIGADPRRIAVAGDSAGGNLAAVVSQLARDHGGPALAFQLLWYPATSFDPSMSSMIENADAPVLNVADIKIFGGYYLGDRKSEDLPVTVVPARAENLSGLPPAYIATAEHDPIRDDGAHYADLLRAAGVPVEYSNHASLVHGYLAFASVLPAAATELAKSISALKAALHPNPADQS